MDPVIIPWYLNWYIPNALFIEYAIKEVLRWAADNVAPIMIITNVLTYLKIWAIKNNRVKDDKILTWLIGFFTFQWVSKITAPIPPEVPKPAVAVGTKTNPVILTEVVDEKTEEQIKEQNAWMERKLQEIKNTAATTKEVGK